MHRCRIESTHNIPYCSIQCGFVSIGKCSDKKTSREVAMARILKIDNDGLFILGQTLQEQDDFRIGKTYLDLENGRVVAFDEKEFDKTEGRNASRYVEIPCKPHGELHELLNEFVWSLPDGKARKAGNETYGIGETLRALDKHMNATWDFYVFVARKWLDIIGISIAE